MATTNKLPEHLAKKYQALIEPTRLHCQTKDDKGNVNGERIIDMRTMSEEDAEWLSKHDDGRYLKKLKEKS